VTWIQAADTVRRRELLADAVARAYTAKALAEGTETLVPEKDDGEIWSTAGDTAIVWALPEKGRVVLADVHAPGLSAAVLWPLLDALATDAGWSGTWQFSACAGQEQALAEHVHARRVATKMRIAVAEVPQPSGIRLVPMDGGDFSAYRAVADEDYAQERFASGAEPTIEESRRVAAAQMAELLPFGPRTPGHRLWVVRDAEDAPAGMLGVHLGDSAAFICDISMDADRRGQGLGTQTLRAAAAETARTGLQTLALNVFGSNDGARRLYTREGYRETEVLWSVPITRT
jgi:GNAT superfamily N-acetyltransferase